MTMVRFSQLPKRLVKLIPKLEHSVLTADSKPKSTVSGGEELLLLQIRSCRLPIPKREFQFDPGRKWRADFYWPDYNLLLEVEGRGRHQSYKGYPLDCLKYNACSMLGYTLLRYTTQQVKEGVAINSLSEFFMQGGKPGQKAS